MEFWLLEEISEPLSISGGACRGVVMFDIQLCISNDFSFIFYFTVAMVYFR